MDSIQRFWSRVGQLGEGRYQPAQATAVLQVASVARDSTGAIVSATGTLDGSGEFTVPLKGHQAAPGDFLLVGYPGNQPVGAELAYLRHVASDYAGAGLVAVDANLPAPQFAAVPWATTLQKLPGSITARGTVYFVAVEARYQPTGYTISYRVDGGAWADIAVPHLGGEQSVVVSTALPPGATVDVHLRARYAWAASESVPTADQTFTAALDDSSPGDVTALTVSTDTPGVLIITPTATIDQDLFRGYQYEINDAATGSPDSTSAPIPGPWDAVLPPGTYYVAARPVSKSGVLGGRFPATGFQGPYTVVAGVMVDTTPPGAIGAPTLAGRVVQFADNSWHGFLTITRPAYTEPADYAATEISIVVDDGRSFVVEMPPGVTVWDGEVGFGQFTVALRGRDTQGNRPAFGATAVETIAAPALSNTAPTVATATVGAGIKVAWNRIAGALAYEVQRATASDGTGATTVATVDSLWYFDPLVSDTVILPTYWYRVRPTSVSNGAVIQGTYSAWVAGTAGAVDAQNLRVASIVSNLIGANQIIANHIAAGAITAAKLEADLVLASLIRTATTGTRWEIRGSGVAAPANVLRFIEAISAVDYERVRLQGSGLTVFGDAAQGDISLNRNSVGRGQLLAHGVTIGHNGTNPFISIAVALAGGGLGQLRLARNTGTDILQQGTYLGAETLVFTRGGTGSDVPALVLDDDSLANNTLGLYPDGIGVSGTTELTLRRDGSGLWASSGGLRAPNLHLGAADALGYAATWGRTHNHGTALGTAAGDSQPLAATIVPSGTATLILEQTAYRGQANTNAGDARFRWRVVTTGGLDAGGLQLGVRNASDPFFGLFTGATARLYWDHANTRILIPDNLHVGGALSKTSGSFVIAHPDPAKRETHQLRHSFIEGPTRGENIYTYVVRFGPRGGGLAVEDSEGKAVKDATIKRLDQATDGGGVARWSVEFDLPDYWRHLNERPRAWVQNTGDGWGRAKARVNPALTELTLLAEEGGEYTIMLLGTRIDPDARAWWDRRGVEKTTGQRWTNDGTVARREGIVAARASREDQRGRVVTLATPFGMPPGLARERPLGQAANIGPGNV